jgi:hypothetical protein
LLRTLDDLYICNACDAAGVPDLIRSSGKHTEDHHLIRCLAPQKADGKAPPTEQRLTSIEGRLDDGMQTQLDDPALTVDPTQRPAAADVLNPHHVPDPGSLTESRRLQRLDARTRCECPVPLFLNTQLRSCDIDVQSAVPYGVKSQ